MLFCQDFNEQFEGYTQPAFTAMLAIHVVLSGFQWTIWRIYTTGEACLSVRQWLFCQDFNEQFEGYTQLGQLRAFFNVCCFVRISMNNLKDIHNIQADCYPMCLLFCQDFNEQFEGYTQLHYKRDGHRDSCFVRISMNNLKDIHNSTACRYSSSAVVLSGFQWTIWRIYTTRHGVGSR